MTLLVTGGGGFLGQAICRALRARGHAVRSFNRGTYEVLDSLGVEQVQGDLANRDAVIDAARGCDAVLHNAAKAGAWGSYDSYFSANVIGTRHVIDACRAHGIDRLVHTSTPSVTTAPRIRWPVAPQTPCRTANISRRRTPPPSSSPSVRCWPPTTRRWRRWRCGHA